MLWTKDSDLELFLAFYDKSGIPVDVTKEWLSIEVKVGRALFSADSNPLKEVVDEETGETTVGEFTNCYITTYDGEDGIMVVIPADTLDFGTAYVRSCVHEPSDKFPDGYREVWNVWLPMDLAIVTEKGLNQ